MYSPRGFAIWKDSGDDTLDTDATIHGYITITPLTTNKTDLALYRKLSGLAE